VALDEQQHHNDHHNELDDQHDAGADIVCSR